MKTSALAVFEPEANGSAQCESDDSLSEIQYKCVRLMLPAVLLYCASQIFVMLFL